MKRKFTFIASTILALGVSFLLGPVIFAQSVSLSISPPVFELSANPGESIKNSIRVTNLGDTPQQVFVDRRNFTALGEEGGVGLTEEETSFSLATWISVDKEEVVIPAKESATFEFTVAVPANAEPGGHFGSLVFKTKPGELKEGQAGSSVGQEVGALLLVKIAGDIKEDASIASFRAVKGFYEKGPITFETRTENKGNVHIKPRGTITITNMFGREVGKVQLDERNVLPGAIRKVETVWDDSGLRFGRYTATLSLVYGADGTIATASTSIFIFPYKLVSVVLVVLGATSFVGYRYRDRFREAYRALAGKR
jgi:hypothetical protein